MTDTNAPWAHRWPLPSPEEALRAAVQGRLSPLERLALLNAGAIGPELLNPNEPLWPQVLPPLQAWDGSVPTRSDRWSWTPSPDTWPDWVYADFQNNAPARGDGWSSWEFQAWVMAWAHAGLPLWETWTEHEDQIGPLRAESLWRRAWARGELELVQVLLAHPDAPAAEVLEAPLALSREGVQAKPVHLAVRAHHVGLVRALVAHGLDPNGVDDTGKTPLFFAASVPMMHALLDVGADPSHRDHQHNDVRQWWTAWPNGKPLVEALQARVPQDDRKSRLFGEVKANTWERIETVLAELSPEEALEWTQPYALKKGTVEASWWVSLALNEALKKSWSNNWFGNQSHWLTASQWLLARITDEHLRHETLPGLPDGLLWWWGLHQVETYTNGMYKGASGWVEKSERVALRNALLPQWHARLEAALGAPVGPAEELRYALRMAQDNRHLTPSDWRNRADEVIKKTLGDQHPKQEVASQWIHTLRLEHPEHGPRLRKGDASLPAREALPSPQEWARFWEVLAPLLQERLGWEWWSEPVNYAMLTAERYHAPLSRSLRETLLPGLLMCHQHLTHQTVSQDVLRLWDHWFDEGLSVPTTPVAEKILKQLHKKDPALAGRWLARQSAQGIAAAFASDPSPSLPPARKPRL